MEHLKERFLFHLKECEKHLEILAEDLRYIEKWIPLKGENIENFKTSWGSWLRFTYSSRGKGWKIFL
jgi:hypothetical protein